MANIKTNHLPCRNSVSCLVFQDDLFLLVQLSGWPKNFWKFPQGGVEPGESEKQAVVRELTEELGTDKFKVLANSPHIHQYDWDRDSIEKARFKWRGQKQRFYLVEFLGKDKDIKVNAGEIQNYQWVKRAELKKHFSHKHKLFVNYMETIEKTLKTVLNHKKDN